MRTELGESQNWTGLLPGDILLWSSVLFSFLEEQRSKDVLV